MNGLFHSRPFDHILLIYLRVSNYRQSHSTCECLITRGFILRCDSLITQLASDYKWAFLLATVWPHSTYLLARVQLQTVSFYLRVSDHTRIYSTVRQSNHTASVRLWMGFSTRDRLTTFYLFTCACPTTDSLILLASVWSHADLFYGATV